MSFTNAPVTRLGVAGLVAVSIAASVLDVKHYFYILIDVHIWRYRQFWRLLAYQLCYVNSSEVLFAAMSLYNLRIVERMWGSRKFAVSFSILRSFCSLLTLYLVFPDCHVLDYLSHPPCHVDFTPTSHCGMAELYPRWTNSHYLCCSGSISCYGPAYVQVSNCYI